MKRLAVAVFAAAVAADLVSKAWAEHDDVSTLLYNTRPGGLPLRLVGSAVAIMAAVVLSRFALRLGLGRQWGLVVGCTLLVAGTLSNGVSAHLWSRGVPDFIDMPGGWVWNVADFEIAVGLAGGLLSVVASALVAYARERASPPPGGDGDASPQLSPR